MPRRSYVGLETRRAWTGQGRQAQVYGARVAHRLDIGSSTGVTATLEAATGRMRGDSSAVHASGAIAASQAIGLGLSLCGAAGLELRAAEAHGSTRMRGADDGYVSTPFSLGLGYDVHVGALTLTPFVAGSVARYHFESQAVAGGATQHGWDRYATTGASASLDRFTVAVAYRSGDHSLGNAGRMAFSTGVTF
jgi:hypothetical protein